MIELIFVIVILGILTAVALPKLSATRDDSENAKDCQNIATCVTDLLAEYTALGTTTLSASAACINAQSSAQNSITFNVTASDVTVSGAPAEVCPKLNTAYNFGGSRVSF